MRDAANETLAPPQDAARRRAHAWCASASATMTTRRDLLCVSALAAATPALAGCGAGGYDEAARATWRHAEALPADAAALRLELVRYATLAANSHNTQPWRFSFVPDGIVMAPDFTRRTPIVDPDDHHLWVSLGCALENLVLAAAAFGLRAEPAFERGALAVRLAPISPTRSLPFDAIPMRQCTRAEYDGKPLAADELRQLASAGSGAGVNVLLLTERMRLAGVLDWVLRGCSAQMRDSDFVLEPKRWIRFSDAEALATRDGLAARASGNPSLPRWAGSLLFGFVFTEAGRRTATRPNCARPAVWRFSSPSARTPRTGSKSAAPTSVSRCSPPRSACATRSSIRRSKCPRCASRSRAGSASARRGRIWSCASAAVRRCRRRCGGRRRRSSSTRRRCARSDFDAVGLRIAPRFAQFVAAGSPPGRASAMIARRVVAEVPMRAALLFALLAAAFQPTHAEDCAFLQRVGFTGERVTGSGRIVEESRALAGFSALKLAGSIDVELRAGDRESVTVRADDNVVPLIETRVDSGTLAIGVARGASFRTQRTPRVLVEFVRLGELAVAGSGDVRADRVRGDAFAVSVAGSGDVKIDALDVNSLGVMLAGSGDFSAGGRADEQGFSIRGSGDVRARDLVGRSVKVSIAGSGDAQVHATERLEVAIVGSGDVVYHGTPKVTKSIAGPGSVRPAR